MGGERAGVRRVKKFEHHSILLSTGDDSSERAGSQRCRDCRGPVRKKPPSIGPTDTVVLCREPIPFRGQWQDAVSYGRGDDRCTPAPVAAAEGPSAGGSSGGSAPGLAAGQRTVSRLPACTGSSSYSRVGESAMRCVTARYDLKVR